MASSLIVHSLCSIASPYTSKCCKSETLTSPSFLKLKERSLRPNFQVKKPRIGNRRSIPVTYAAYSNFLKVMQTVWKVGKDSVEAGTNLVPDSVPRPAARISVTIVALSISLFVLKSFLSTAFFALATMGLAYFIFIGLNKDQGPRGTNSSEDPLEEARRIMDKYK